MKRSGKGRKWVQTHMVLSTGGGDGANRTVLAVTCVSESAVCTETSSPYHMYIVIVVSGHR